jgi:cytochrome c oxidase subunit 1
VVTSRDPLWEGNDALPVASGVRTDRRELLVTSVIEGLPEARESSPRDSIWPLWAALATSLLLIWSIFSPWAIVWGSIPLMITLIGWFWPKGSAEDAS